MVLAHLVGQEGCVGPLSHLGGLAHTRTYLSLAATLLLPIKTGTRLRCGPAMSSVYVPPSGYHTHCMHAPAPQDADSLDAESGKQKEGEFYLWTADEINCLLGG